MSPEYEGLTPILMPADGRTLSRHDWPQCYNKIGGAVWQDGESFALPTRSTEISRDPASFSHIRRDFMVNVRTGAYCIEDTMTDDYEEIMRR